MIAIDEAFFQHEGAKVMARITEALSLLLDTSVEPSQRSYRESHAVIIALTEAGHRPPEDLDLRIEEFVQGVRDTYQRQHDAAEQVLAYSPEIQAALGINVRAEEFRLLRTSQWLEAIDLIWSTL
jgi:hypothetical protein